ncbi:nucleolin-like [Parambassis ranga]|uniref:Nucleolin-like n=1 Tax=Parambassis ranga TaxID=210632 RepID=A0A6P7K4W6_9TELE|nr:nucleolin-like [Parambassis ranga]
MATRRSKRQSKVGKAEEEEDTVKTRENTETVSSREQTVNITSTKSAELEMKQEEEEGCEEQASQMNIEVKGNTCTVTVSWEKKNEERNGEDTEQMTSAEKEEKTLKSSPADAVDYTEETPNQAADIDMEKAEEEECQKDSVTKDTETVPCEKTRKKTRVTTKRKTDPAPETSPSKKTKLINDGLSLFVGNLNNSKTQEEVKSSLQNYFIEQGVLFQDIRLGRTRKHALIDVVSEMDMTKALKLNGEVILEKPVLITRARVRSTDKVKAKAPPLDKKVKDGRCLFLKNVPYNATKKDILKVFRKAVAVRFPGGTEGPSQGIAFVEFKNKITAQKVRQRKQGVKIQGRVLIVSGVGEANMSAVTKSKADDNKGKAAAPSNILFVRNLPHTVREKDLKNAFQKAVGISIPRSNGKRRGFAFVEFASVADAEKALQASQNIKVCQKEVKVEFSENAKPDKEKVSKTLIVMGLAERTTADTLKCAFEGALSARVAVDRETGVSKRFGFVEFENEETSKAVKEDMEDCEIDGSKVMVAYAKAKGEKGQGAKRQSAGPTAGRGGRRLGAVTLQAAVKEVNRKN